MRLIEITLDYPHSVGETFVKDELDIASSYFDEIIIISLSGHIKRGVKRYVPQNARVINARRGRYEIIPLFVSALKVFSYKTVRECFFTLNTLRKKEKLSFVLKNIYIYYYYEFILFRSFKKLELSDDDILYSYWLAGPAYGIANLKTDNIKVARTHRFDCYIDFSYQPFRREVLEGIDVVFSVSDSGKQSITQRLLPLCKEKHADIKVSRLGIIDKNQHGETVYEKDKEFRVLTCSNINPVKRLDLIVDALQRIFIPIKWIHIGDGELKEEIIAYANRISNQNNHIVFLGQLTQDEVFSFYSNNQIDAFINCSDSEGIPVSIMEACSYGIPIIARDVGGNREIVSEENGVLLPRDANGDDIAKAIMTIYDMDLQSYLNMRMKSREIFKKKYNATSNYKHFFEDIISLKRKGTARK